MYARYGGSNLLHVFFKLCTDIPFHKIAWSSSLVTNVSHCNLVVFHPATRRLVLNIVNRDAVSRCNGDSAATGKDVLQLKQGPVVVLSNRSVYFYRTNLMCL